MLGAKLGISDYLTRVCREIQRLDPAQIEKVSELIEAAYDEGRFVFIIGNGGSGANASHLCEDLAKCTLRDFENQKRLKVLSLTDNTAGIMAWANDEGYDRIFVEQLKNLASPGDLLLAISGSGNSPNILKAVDLGQRARPDDRRVHRFSGGKLKTLAHHNLHAGIDDMGIVESLHQVVFHWIIDDLYRRFSAKEAVLNGGRGPLIAWPIPWVLGIEIGGTKLQLGIGRGQGSILALERFAVDPARGAAGILDQIQAAFPRCSRRPSLASAQIEAAGIGFGGPVDADERTHPKILPDRRLGRFPARRLGRRASRGPARRPRKRRRYRRPGGSPVRRGHRSLAAPLHDRRQRHRRRPDRRSTGSTAGSARVRSRSDTCGCRIARPRTSSPRSNWSKSPPAGPSLRRPRTRPPEESRKARDDWAVLDQCQGDPDRITAAMVAEAALGGDPDSSAILDRARSAVAFALTQAITLARTATHRHRRRRLLVGEKLWFDPIRRLIDHDVFRAVPRRIRHRPGRARRGSRRARGPGTRSRRHRRRQTSFDPDSIAAIPPSNAAF